jgi:hypothetical protein
MKNILILFFCAGFHCVLAQKSNLCEIILDKSILKTSHPKKNYYWIINGERYDNTNSTFKIKTHYPLVDTIQFCDITHNFQNTILTRFKPANTYYFKGGCCNEGFDLVSEYEYAQMKNSSNHDENRIKILNRTIFTFEVRGLPINDSLICYFGDNYSVNSNAYHSIKKNNKKYNIAIDKNDGTNFISHFLVSKSSIEDEILNFQMRFMETKKVNIIYNYQSKEIIFQFN